ncbi:hypothetical protein NX801_27495 [Streptomyces sp. LP05-1]|uniref:Uncharacterized protein n=1 Tax=Streptomyces pyxinae TaxID=2970734 RepID=A0ABT2CQE4_9ACTN|nr:hypothetical protein [Streptomyces sp. LP05-1]MCS0639317.1 hypothetical protein [Streptomyces sp. LP05-1]
MVDEYRAVVPEGEHRAGGEKTAEAKPEEKTEEAKTEDGRRKPETESRKPEAGRRTEQHGAARKSTAVTQQ